MADAFSRHIAGLDSPYENAALITPHDTTELTNATRAIYVGVAGHIRLTTVKGNDVLLENVPVGVLRIRAKLIHTDTAATKLVALW